MSTNTIKIFDTTLRDGEQSPGASMDIPQKIEIAHCLANMGIDAIEAGFPVSSPEQFQATKIIGKEVRNATITALSRAVKKDIESASEALVHAEHPRIHTFLASSPIYREYKLKKSKEEVLEIAKEAVRYARNLCAEVEFSPEDAMRTEHDFLAQVVETAIDAGATIINIPDTVGHATPTEVYEMIIFLRNTIPNIDKAILSIHCHDDLGLATANTLHAIRAGVQQAEVTVNGIGERAGNAALEEVIVGLALREDFWNTKTNVDASKIYSISKLLSATIGFPVPRNKAIIGDNAFAHEAGIHQDGVLKHSSTYEILTPEFVGRTTNNTVLGRHSGLHGLRNRLQQLNIYVDEKKIQTLYKRFLEIADKKTEIYDSDLYALASNVNQDEKKHITLVRFQLYLTTRKSPRAKMVLDTPDGRKTNEGTGDGPVDAIFTAISGMFDYTIELGEYRVTASSPGTNAMGEVAIVATINKVECTGHASSTDILQASAEAYISAINHYLLHIYYKDKLHLG